MKSLILSIALALTGFSAGAQEFAPEVSSRPAGCNMKFSVHIDSVLIVSRGHGRGTVTCEAADHSVYAQAPVTIEIEGLGLGLGTFDMSGVAGSLGINNPSELVGTYAVAQASVAVGAAVGASLGFYGQRNGLNFSGILDAGHGVGVFLNGTTWDIQIAR